MRPSTRVVASTFGRMLRPIQEFFRLEAASGVLLFLAAVVSMLWANSGASDSYHRLLGLPVTVGIPGHELTVTARGVINEALMAIFFFLVGMEIKRELASGELRTFRRAMLPLVAAASLVGSPEDNNLDDASILHIEEKLEDVEAPLTRFVHALHPWVAFGIMPLFALANAGVTLKGMTLADSLGAVSLGAALGLVVGKPVGIFLATLAAVRAKLAERPGGASWLQVGGVGVVGGIGFTVALFIAALAYPQTPALLDQAKVGILSASVVAALGGTFLLLAAGRGTRHSGVPAATVDARTGDQVDEAGRESFPASDPPAWTLGTEPR